MSPPALPPPPPIGPRFVARDTHFLLGLEKAGVEFIAADMPCANRPTIGVMASVAEAEARATSVRTKAALAAAKVRGTRLGNPNLRRGDAAGASQARAIRSAMAATRALKAAPYIVAARQAGATTLGELAVALTARGVRTPRGHEKRTPWQIYERPQDGRGRAVHSSSATSSDLTGRS